jgi:hypothetical protein
MTVANPAPLMMSAKRYCSSLIEAFISPVSLALSSHRSPDMETPRRLWAALFAFTVSCFATPSRCQMGTKMGPSFSIVFTRVPPAPAFKKAH